jgi:hypothetical protein
VAIVNHNTLVPIAQNSMCERSPRNAKAADPRPGFTGGPSRLTPAPC